MARHGSTWLDMARRGSTWLDMARRGSECQIEVPHQKELPEQVSGLFRQISAPNSTQMYLMGPNALQQGKFRITRRS